MLSCSLGSAIKKKNKNKKKAGSSPGTARTSRMQIKNRTKRIDKASKAKQIANWNQKLIRCVQTHAGKKGKPRNASGRGYWVYTCNERPQGRFR